MLKLKVFATVTFTVFTALFIGCANQRGALSEGNSSAKIIPQVEQQKSILLSAYLDLEHPSFFFTTEDGMRFKDELQTFKTLESVYADVKERVTQNQSASVDDVKLLLFFTAYAHNKNSGAFSEYLNSDLTPIFEQHSEIFLQALSQLPFLIPHTCYHLNKYFGFEGKNQDLKDDFLKQHKKNIFSSLGEAQGNKCLAALK